MPTDMATLRDWMGAAPGEKLSRDHHEKFARGFEAYLMEGKAPNSKVAEAFDRFSGWLTRIYKSVLAILQIEGVTLNDDIRQVMDRLVGVEQGFVQLEAENPRCIQAPRRWASRRRSTRPTRIGTTRR